MHTVPMCGPADRARASSASKDERKEFRKSLQGNTVVLKKPLLNVMVPGLDIWRAGSMTRSVGVVALSPKLGLQYRLWSIQDAKWLVDTDFDRFMIKVTGEAANAPMNRGGGVVGALSSASVPNAKSPAVLDFPVGTVMNVEKVFLEDGMSHKGEIVIWLKGEFDDKTTLTVQWPEKFSNDDRRLEQFGGLSP